MKKLSWTEKKKLSFMQLFLYNIAMFFVSIPAFFVKLGKAIVKGVKTVGIAIGKELKDVAMTFVNGSINTKISYLIMGFGNFTRGQVVRGLLFLLFEGAFVAYTILIGSGWMAQLGTLGVNERGTKLDPVLDVWVDVPGDNSFKILLYGGLSIVFCLVFILVWRMNIKQSKEVDATIALGKKPQNFRRDLHDLVDAKFHKTLLAVPILGITLFTVLPILFMIAVAFTGYDGAHDGYSNLFHWVGFSNFAQLFDIKSSNLGSTFGKILGWTLIWAFFATFTNYFLGMIVAMMINKKGIKLKKMWRGIFVMTIAIPQFISLMYISKLFTKTGMVNAFLIWLYNNTNGFIGIKSTFDFWANPLTARILVILVNIWIGIPYLILICTGILMNIPDDLYESARIDGANAFQQFTRITLPYMLFITGPYLLTSFIGNINNFNVIFLLTGDAPANPSMTVNGTAAKDVDLLITWLYNITTGAASDYKLASVVGILIFLVVSILSVIAYNVMPSNKNEEDFQ